MQRLALALSGGGFRATLYHLGVIRFLRDAGLLAKVSSISTVSGGSVIGAHLALNWDRYCGSPDDFDAAAAEVIRFCQLDVRNRIVRRFPFASALNIARRGLRLKGKRQLTRAGLLESHYREFLFGDIPLQRLPKEPDLHILTTNVSEGCLCAFDRRGLLIQRRTAGKRDRFERIEMSLSTVAMAVAASSAFPGFFPPLELRGWDVGLSDGEFSRQAFTDGGVYDNLGLRFFRCFESGGNAEIQSLLTSDVLEPEAIHSALRSAVNLPTDSPLRELQRTFHRYDSEGTLGSLDSANSAFVRTFVRIVSELTRTTRLYRLPAFQGLELTDANAQKLLNYASTSEKALELDDAAWLNRHIVEAVLCQAVGKPCLRLGRTPFDTVLVSDAGSPFKIASSRRSAGLISTALRATDILMDRVWQLEIDSFSNSTGTLRFPITETVDASHDHTAPDLSLQIQAARVRTDLDRFSDLEISVLVQHGYCVARKVARGDTGLHSQIHEAANVSPWTPIQNALPKPPSDFSREVTTDGMRQSQQADSALVAAKVLRRSSIRRIWTTLVDLHDWPSFVWIGLLLAFLIGIPSYVIQARHHASQQKIVLSSLVAMNPSARKVLHLLENKPSATFAELPVRDFPEPTGGPNKNDSIRILSDTRIFDLRLQEGTDLVTVYARMDVERLAGSSDTDARLLIPCPVVAEKLRFSIHPPEISATLLQTSVEGVDTPRFLELDLQTIAPGRRRDLFLEYEFPMHRTVKSAKEGRLLFRIFVETGLFEGWVLFPEKRQHGHLEVVSSPLGEESEQTVVVPFSQVETSAGTLASFRIIQPAVGQQYECRWTWLDRVKNPWEYD